jgi:ribosomal protein L37AE/L43A
MSDMFLLKAKASGRIDSVVLYSGKEGVVIERLSNMLKIRFEDGEYAWASIDEVQEVLQDSRLKSMGCPSCKSFECKEVMEEKAYGGDTIFQCMKCSDRFTIQVKEIKLKTARVYCKNCGKKNAKEMSKGLFKCDSCDSTFN